MWLESCTIFLVFFVSCIDLSHSIYSNGESESTSAATQKSFTVHLQKDLASRDLVNCPCLPGNVRDVFRDDYTYTYGVGLHKFHTFSKTWNEARKICNEEGAHLAIINTNAEESALMDLMQKYKHDVKDASFKDQAFLGIHDMFNEGEWLTLWGEPIHSTGYAKWFYQDNAGGNENCGALIASGSLNDMSCNLKLPFLCEIPI